jgi:hypothetical protein
MEEKLTLVQSEVDPTLLWMHQQLTTGYTDTTPGMIRVSCLECGKTIEIPLINIVQNEGAFDGIVNIAFGRTLR